MQQPFSKLLMLENRLQKVYRHLSRQAARQGITSYRVHDNDLSEFPFVIELYDDKVYVSEYKGRHTLLQEEHEQWLRECSEAMGRVLGIPVENIFLKERRRKAGRLGQYQKLDERCRQFVVTE